METVKEEMEVAFPELPRIHTSVSFRPALQQLHKQRRETAALRDLWHSLAKKRQRRQQDVNACPADFKLHFTSGVAKSGCLTNDIGEDAATKPSNVYDAHAYTRPATNAETAHTAREDKPHLPSISDSLDVTTLLHGPYRSATGISAGNTTSPKHHVTPRRQQGDVTSPTRLRCDDDRSPLAYHTAVTQRPGRSRSPSFRALTQLCCTPLPQLIEGVVSRSYTATPGARRDIREWENEIVKVVPTRPQFVQALPPQSLESPEVKTCRYPYKVINFDPSCHFYRSWSKISDKDYVISPEWSSEKSLIRAGISSRAKTGLSLRHDLHE